MIKDNRDGGGSVGALWGVLFFEDCKSKGAVGISGVVSGVDFWGRFCLSWK